MNDHAYLYANTSDKSIMYDLAVHCALVEVLPVPGGGLKRVLSSSPSLSGSRFNQHLWSSGCEISCCCCCLLTVCWWHWQPPLLPRGWGWERLLGRGTEGATVGTLGWEAVGVGMAASDRLGCHRLLPPDFKLIWSTVTPQVGSVLPVLLPFPIQRAAVHEIHLHLLSVTLSSLSL